ncbi:MAG TPA: polysaccharide deacetylase family protein [Allosphingosinicella sp.]|jgi:peptidoglycan/xylan/chitin deacetylase (PgdA/CDA1 family)
MATRVLLTIDTELTWRHSAAGVGDWRDNVARSFDPAGVGVPYQLGMLRRHGLKACFFVDPMPALVHGIEPIRAMVQPILAAGQEVQLHLHSFWADLAAGRESPRFELTGFDQEEQLAIIARARALLIEAGAPPPIAFRSGSYAADERTLAALRQLGLRYDSSHNGAEHPWPSALPLEPALVDPIDCEGVVELPVSQIRRRDGGLRPFQICALSSQEMRAALGHAATNNHPVVTIVSHSFELASRDGRRVNALVRGRFHALCSFLAKNRESMPTAAFAELPPFAPRVRSEPLPARGARTLRRMAEQAWGNARYERPTTLAAVVAAASVPAAAFGYLVANGGL